MATQIQWYFVENGQRSGPVDLIELGRMLRAGRVGPQTLVWSDGMQDWAPLDQTDAGELLGERRAPPSVPAAVPAPAYEGAVYAGGSYQGAPVAGGGPGAPMGFFEAIASCFNKYVQFSGRASRSEYWYFQLFTSLCFFLVFLVAGVSMGAGSESAAGGAIILVLSLAFMLPSLSVLVRRLHDTDRSGWWYWISLVPLVGPIVLLVFLCLAPTPGPNRFG